MSLFKSLLFLALVFSRSYAQDVSSRYEKLIQGDVESVLKSMTLEEKIGQLFYIFFYGDQINEEALELMRSTHAGNIIYYTWANGLNEFEKVKELSKAVQDEMKERLGIPALIGIDQEGGIVSRLQGQFTEFPGAMALSAGASLEEVREMSLAMGLEMGAVGINIDFAPVVDINSTQNNPVIGTRSFGDDPNKVIAYAKVFCESLHNANVACTLKHYPGHGDTEKDSHLGLPILTYSKKELFKRELLPFIALKDEADAIMVAHILLPKIDPLLPASISPHLIKKMLRDKIGYKGLIISDSLAMKGIAVLQDNPKEAIDTIQQIASLSFLAGNDQMILGRLEWADFDEKLKAQMNLDLVKATLNYFKQAVNDGRIDEISIDQSVRRILRLKSKLLMKKMDYSKVDFVDHQKLAQKLSRQAVTLLSSKSHCKEIKPLNPSSTLILAPTSLKSSLNALGEGYQCVFLGKEDLNEEELILQAKQFDRVLFLGFRLAQNKKQQKILEELSATLTSPHLIIVGLSNPYEVLPYSSNHLVYLTYGSSLESLKALFYILEGGFCPTGKSPLNLKI